jgi:hypothetical protein
MVIGINTAIASMSGGNDGVGFAVPVEAFDSLLEEVEAAGGVDAPTVPAPEGSGLDQLVPGFDDLLPGLDELLPGLGELLEELFSSAEPPPSDPAPPTPTPADPSPDSAPMQPEPLPGIDEFFEDFFFVPDDPFGELPGLDELLNEMFGTDLVPPELQDVLDELFGSSGTVPDSGGGSQ